jgi:hypothetical protein
MIAVERVCAFCGGPFDHAETRRADTEFCSSRCRQASYRRRRATAPVDLRLEYLADVVWRLRVRGEIDGVEAFFLLVFPPADALERLEAAT